MKSRPTVIDVANHAGVGASTVSRYLRGVKLRPALATRVDAAVKALDYHPNETARALRGGRSRTIGVVVPKVSNVFFSQSVQLMEEEARKRGCAVILLTHQDRMPQQEEHLKTLRRYHVDGIIMAATPETTAEDLQAVLPDVPFVAFDNLFSTSVDSVVLANRKAARLATAHLIKHGYRSILCVTGRPEIYSFRERIAGYESAMRRAKLKPNFITAPDYEQLKAMLRQSFKAGERPDALLSLSDLSTLTIITAANDMGLRGSKRIPLIGFDDFGFAPLMDPPLTVVRQPIERMVQYAMNKLFNRIDGSRTDTVEQVLFPGELVCRRSCGCHTIL